MSNYYRSILNVQSPSFTNTKSVIFDGVDDFVTLGSPVNLRITGSSGS